MSREIKVPPEWEHQREAYLKGYEKGKRVREAMKRYASGGRIENLQRAIAKAHDNG